MKTKDVSVQFKAGPDDGLAEGQFVVYPATFIRKADSYGDVIAPTAFDDDVIAWEESGNVLPGLYGHRMDDPDFFIASATDVGVDEHGWRVQGEFDLDNPKAQQVYRLVKSKRLTQMSFAYDTLDEGSVDLEDGTKANELRKVKTYEFSFVPIGANQDTSIFAVKAAADQIVAAAKAGRVLAQKHIDSLRSAQEAIGVVITAAEATQEEPKATGAEPDRAAAAVAAVKAATAAAADPAPSPSADDLRAQLLQLSIA